jgi:hypothetical protein
MPIIDLALFVRKLVLVMGKLCFFFFFLCVCACVCVCHLWAIIERKSPL